MIKVNCKLQQSDPDITTNGPDSLVIKVEVTPPGKDSRPAEVCAEDKRNIEWIVEEGSFKYQL